MWRGGSSYCTGEILDLLRDFRTSLGIGEVNVFPFYPRISTEPTAVPYSISIFYPIEEGKQGMYYAHKWKHPLC
jgi:hypothetical protein